ncbi:response regulator transcription factor [Paenibacillus alkalitolerans]|uniref:response regulator transcription factor n=1 Tax=Paenibacillus alkalitolerans TaxID=2799335 RepID=UPI0018F4307F|nr:response regulator [Paenibacillus alkalitolerans]
MDANSIQLLIVDDEDSVVDSLADTIDWTAVGITNVYKAYSGYEALEILNTNTIDIVITDIRMPGISGLELIARIRKSWKRIKCILLSGHAEFAYAQKAIAQEAFEYLLKPVSDEDVLTTAGNAVQALRKERNENQSYERLVKTYQEHLPKIRAELLNGLIQGMKFLPGQLSEKLDSLRLHLQTGEPLALVTLRMEGRLSELDFYNLSLMEYAIGNMAQELCEGSFRLWNCKDVHGYLIYAVTLSSELKECNLEEASRQLQSFATQLQLNVKRYLKGSVSILISKWGSFPHDIRSLYDENLLLLRKRVGNQSGLFICATEDSEQSPVHSLQRLYEPPMLIHLLESGNWEQAHDKLSGICNELRQHWSNSQEHLTEAYFYVYSSYSSFSHKHGRSLTELIGPGLSATAGLAPSRSIGALESWVFQSYDLLQQSVEMEPRNDREEVVAKIKRFIQDHLLQDVSLQTIADKMRIHPVHVSRLFKLETGENLSDYVLRLKMELAAALLADPSLKNYEISLRLGYQNPNYFIKVFKKYYALTPQEYRIKLDASASEHNSSC